MVTPALKFIESKNDPAELQVMLSQMQSSLPMMESRKDQMPPGAIDGMKYVLKKLQQRIDELNAAKNQSSQEKN